MMSVSNLRIPTPLMLKLLLFAYFNKYVSFSRQDLCKDRRYFNKTIHDLLRWNVVEKNTMLENGHFFEAYVLNLNGVILVKEFIYDFHKCTVDSRAEA